MRLVHHTPPEPLGRFVRLWSCEAPELPDLLERSLPDGTMTLYVNLAEDEIRWYDGELRCQRVGGASLGGAAALKLSNRAPSPAGTLSP